MPTTRMPSTVDFPVFAGSIAVVAALGVHHVGIAVADLDEAVDLYRRLFGAELERRGAVPGEAVEAALLRVGEGLVELLASDDPESPVGKFLAERGPAMH